MKFALVSAVLMACALVAECQISVDLNHPANRSPEIEIRNRSAAALVAVAVTMAPVADQDRPPYVIFADIAVPSDRPVGELRTVVLPIQPGASFAIPLPVRFPRGASLEALYKPPITTAGVFADGVTTGDPGLLARLIARRASALQAIEMAISMLSDAGSHNPSRERLVADFQRMADSLNHWYLPPEQQVGRALYQSLAGKLRNVPDLPYGSAFPPTGFVEQEVATLKLQRMALLESQPSLAQAVPRK